jgi:hypothetical protein
LGRGKAARCRQSQSNGGDQAGVVRSAGSGGEGTGSGLDLRQPGRGGRREGTRYIGRRRWLLDRDGEVKGQLHLDGDRMSAPGRKQGDREVMC